MTRRFDGRVAVVTGGARGIGKAVVRRLLQEGACVHAADRREDVLRATAVELAYLGPLQTHVVDITSRERVESLIAACAQADVLVNNAGIGPRVPTASLDDAALQRIFDVNLRGALIASQAASRWMQSRGRGSIVNVASVNALRGQPDMLAYNASKAAMVSMTLTMSVELAASGVRVNCVCPGSVDTDIWEEGGWTQRDKERFATHIPLRRLASPDEVAAAVAFLASDDASYVTGHTLVVDGGLTVKM